MKLDEKKNKVYKKKLPAIIIICNLESFLFSQHMRKRGGKGNLKQKN
jgi:hypothetical protein